MMSRLQQSKITAGLILICFVIYLYTTFKYGMSMNAVEGIEAGGFNPLYVVYYHQYYRLLTANFIHFGIFHLLANCYSLYAFGMFLEYVIRFKRFLLLTIFSLLFTTSIPLLIYFINGFGANTVLGGISGVIFSYLGAFTYLSFRYRDVFKRIFNQLIPILFLNLFISVSVPSISLVGHLGGYIGGIIIMFILERFYPLYKRETS